MRETGGFALAAPNDAEHLRRSSNIVGTVGPELDRFVSQPAGNEETPGPTLQSYTLNAPRAMTGQYWNGTDQRLTRLIHHNYRAGVAVQIQDRRRRGQEPGRCRKKDGAGLRDTRPRFDRVCDCHNNYWRRLGDASRSNILIRKRRLSDARLRRIGVVIKGSALTYRAGASDNKGRSRVTIAPTKGDQMCLAVGHRAASAARSNGGQNCS